MSKDPTAASQRLIVPGQPGHRRNRMMAQSLEGSIHNALRTPIGANDDPDFGFDALDADGSTKLGMSEQVLAAMARKTLTHCIPGVVFNEITAHRDENGQLMRIEVDYMDEIHDPSSRSTTVEFGSGV